ncbi:MAG TPA: arabinan endo-1,5-alpha-L-arabinosidase, partial [Opitutaceae bacterium]|nr:arabinan endo-1,5-alpha-L-arabinosidase [Opitutaceae bacterium]
PPGPAMIMKTISLSLLLLGAALSAQTPPAAPLVTDVPMHDPVMARQDGVYYAFGTGNGIAVWSSTDRVHWRHEAPVFAGPPAWAVAAVPTFRGHIWAPDISYHDGRYYLYYAVSAFGKNTSCIGVATNTTLDPRAPNFKWEDHGKIIQSVPGVTNWNAIDPNLIAAADGTPYLVFGSFWDGLKLVKLTPDRLHLAEPLDRMPTIASRKPEAAAPNPPALAGDPVDAGGNAIEAPFLFQHGDYYYLFASIDYCCKGVNSTYKMIVGRAKEIPGPYVDEAGAPLAHGGGTILLAGDARWHGVGHCAVYSFDGVDYLIFHGYDGNAHGLSKLRIERLRWTPDGWPRVEVAAP